MTHHTDDHEVEHVVLEGDGGGRGMEPEKWILRMMLLAVTAVTVVAIVASLDDIKRYLRMRQM